MVEDMIDVLSVSIWASYMAWNRQRTLGHSDNERLDHLRMLVAILLERLARTKSARLDGI
jgi:hypothetical protein